MILYNKLQSLILPFCILFISYQSFSNRSSSELSDISTVKESEVHPSLIAKSKKTHLTWEELKEAILEYNKTAPEGERINSKSYLDRKLYKKIPGAPSSPRLLYSDFKERGGWWALLGKTHLTWEELREAILEYNKTAPEGERINSNSYLDRKLYKRIPGAPSSPRLLYSDFKERGGWWALLGKTHLTWEELKEAILEYNKTASEGERINSQSYRKRKLYKRIPGAPSSPRLLYSDFKERGGWRALLGKTHLTWEELREAILEYNKTAPEGERINSQSYLLDRKLYKKIPGAPSDPPVFYSDFKERGGWWALLSKTHLTWEELREAILEYNKTAPEGEKINSQSYRKRKLHKRIPNAPSNPPVFYSDFKERGGWRALLGKTHLTWEELREAILEYNKTAPEGEKINSKSYLDRKLYKRIPGAPSNPRLFYSDFKERGRWWALLGKVCQRAF